MTDIPTRETEVPDHEKAFAEFESAMRKELELSDDTALWEVVGTSEVSFGFRAWQARPARDAEVDRLKADIEHLQNTAPLRREKLNQLIHYRNEVKALREALVLIQSYSYRWKQASRGTIRLALRHIYEEAQAALKTEDKDAN